MENFDVVVIGAGWFGLAAAKAYIELHPFDSLVVLEAASSVGGVWAEHRMYPGLKSNNMVGTYEYPDFPMSTKRYGVAPGQHIPGPVLHQYLVDYAQEFGVLERVRLNTKIESAEQTADRGWLLTTSDPRHEAINTRKLIIATGLTSQPFIPQMSGMETFQAPLFHPRDFRDYQETLKTAKNAVVLGGAKSAWDVAYAYAQAGVQVDMVIRPSGHGPVWMAPPYVTPLKKWLEKLVHTRFLTWFSPCVWGDEDGYSGIRSLMHGTAIGRFVVDTFWKILGGDVIALNKYDSHPELKKLKPWDDAFYIGSALSIHNYPTSFFDMVREGKIRVNIDAIEKLQPNEVRLASGKVLKADVFVSATGWTKKSSVKFIGEASNMIGLQQPQAELEDLVADADSEILHRFPRLQRQPPRRAQLEAATAEKCPTTMRMYRFMVPPLMVSNRNIVFAGMCSSISTSMVATAQALWISAFLDNKLDRLPNSKDEINWQTVLYSQYGKWRYPTGYGPRFPDFVFDALPYLDMLLKDLGMKTSRKSGAFSEITSPYGPEDYTGLISEWRKGHNKDTGAIRTSLV